TRPLSLKTLWPGCVGTCPGRSGLRPGPTPPFRPPGGGRTRSRAGRRRPVTMVDIISLTACVPDADVDALRGKLIGDDHYDFLVGGRSTCVLKPDGSPLIVFLHGTLKAEVRRPAFPALLRAAVPSTNRGDAAGR